MREILFRAKAIDTGEWVEGYYLPVETEPAIFTRIDWIDGSELNSTAWHFVDPSTIGQFTGLCDKAGKRIFKGDIVKFSNNPIHEGVISACKWLDWRVGFVYEFITGDHKGKFTDMTDTWRDYEVIGTIWDNPELLKGGKK